MAVGQMITIYYKCYKTAFDVDRFIDTMGLIVAKHGYKCEVLVDGELQIWDERDLVKMGLDKNGY